MPIYRRHDEAVKRSQAYIKDFEARATERDHEGKHELLRTSTPHAIIYDYIRTHPDCTRDEARTETGYNRRRVSELIAEGLVVESNKVGHTGQLRVVEGASVGRKLDLIHVDIEVYVNDFGEYSIKTTLRGAVKWANKRGNPQLVKTQVASIRIPKPKDKITETFDGTLIVDLTPTVIDEN